ncbi:hypothetical protein HELRODRAFT_181592 [Helobdella robusta]|uniref:Ig-like domain-containing protein n=1 Tax=Helobdella robusta TaxID=6412 RepID=T1FH51_HELRO|nr:hypothetical protein HELRODRAFT_181592 [Helobdella robusta]ESN92253.1 hypothetical protein HELRODRAFT_181592 [Helobdella robusta]
MYKVCIVETVPRMLRMLSQGGTLYARVGSNAHLQCSFTGNGYDSFRAPVLWSKRQLSDDVIEINHMSQIQLPFFQSARFSISFTNNSANTYSTDLAISELKPTDTGNYTCQVKWPRENVLVHYELVVLSGPDIKSSLQVLRTTQHNSDNAVYETISRYRYRNQHHNHHFLNTIPYFYSNNIISSSNNNNKNNNNEVESISINNINSNHMYSQQHHPNVNKHRHSNKHGNNLQHQQHHLHHPSYPHRQQNNIINNNNINNNNNIKNDLVLAIREKDETTVTCEVVSGFLIPAISIFVKNRNITDLFERKIVRNVEGQRPFRLIWHVITMTSHKLTFRYSDDDSNLICQATKKQQQNKKAILMNECSIVNDDDDEDEEEDDDEEEEEEEDDDEEEEDDGDDEEEGKEGEDNNRGVIKRCSVDVHKFKGVGVHRAENLDAYWQEFHRGEGIPIFFHFLTRRNRCNKHEMWLVAKNSSLLSPDLTLIILHIALRRLRMLGSIGPKTSIHIGKNSIDGRAFPYFFIFSSAALAAAKPHSLLVRFTYRLARVPGTVTSHANRSARVPGTVTSHAKHLPALQGISVHPSERLPSCAEMPDGSLRTGIEALEKSRQMCWSRRPSRPPEEPFLNDLTALSTSVEETQPAVGVNAGKTRLSTGVFGWMEHNLSKVAGELSARPSSEQTSLTAEDRRLDKH